LAKVVKEKQEELPLKIEMDSKLRSPAKFITIAVTVQLVSNKKKKEEYKNRKKKKK
jgi:hypothetical protein